jgi:hypothetical protein
MARLTRTMRRKLEAVYQWYEEEYKPWWLTHSQDFIEFQRWKEARLKSWPVPSRIPSALWPPRSQP